MDNQGRRSRRGRPRYRQVSPPPTSILTSNSSFLGGAKNVAVTFVVLGLMLMMIQHNHKNSQSRQELNKLASSVDQITKYLHTIKNNYDLLETKLAVYSQELPILEGQMKALEVLARDLNHRSHGPLSDAQQIKLNKTIQNNQNKPVRNATKIMKRVQRKHIVQKI